MIHERQEILGASRPLLALVYRFWCRRRSFKGSNRSFGARQNLCWPQCADFRVGGRSVKGSNRSFWVRQDLCWPYFTGFSVGGRQTRGQTDRFGHGEALLALVYWV